jgi:hypothetical protein
MKSLEIISRIAWIWSLLVGVVWLFLIKPAYKFFSNKIIDESILKNNKWKVALNKNWDNYLSDTMTNITFNLSPKNNIDD